MRHHQFFITLVAILALGLGGIYSTVRVAESRMTLRNPFTQVLVHDKDGKEYWADIIVDLEAFSDEKDRSRLLRVVDRDARVLIYITQNDTASMFTSMQVLSKILLDPNSDFYKRMDW